MVKTSIWERSPSTFGISNNFISDLSYLKIFVKESIWVFFLYAHVLCCYTHSLYGMRILLLEVMLIYCIILFCCVLRSWFDPCYFLFFVFFVAIISRWNKWLKIPVITTFHNSHKLKGWRCQRFSKDWFSHPLMRKVEISYWHGSSPYESGW